LGGADPNVNTALSPEIGGDGDARDRALRAAEERAKAVGGHLSHVLMTSNRLMESLGYYELTVMV